MNWEYIVLDTRKNSCNELMRRVIEGKLYVMNMCIVVVGNRGI